MALAAERGQASHLRVTVMKADISGSTVLAERLDPEQLRVVLGTYFAALAREIHRNGGVIDKYVGDGVIAVFGVPTPSEDDAERAVIAGFAMQQAIERENAELEIRHGVRLACRIGVSTGDVVAGALAEEVQATYTVVGAPVAAAEALESACPLGAVLVSPTTYDVTRDVIEFAETEHVRPKGTAGAITAHRVVRPRRTARTVEELMRSEDRSTSLQITEGGAQLLAEERKIVTVLFADLISSEPLASRLPPERLRAVLGAYFSVLAREIQRYGGTIDKYVGDAVMAVFGAPVSHEDDAARAIRAALAIERSSRLVTEMLERTDGVRAAIRVGVNTGEVVAGLLSGEVLAYTVTGDAVNTAQRIESAAGPGEVLVSEPTRALARDLFQFEAVAPLTLKGKREPVPAYRVTGFALEAGSVAAGAFVGREAELAWLRSAIDRSIHGEGQVLHVQGEGGAGKSRLAREALATLTTEVAQIRARANSYEESTPYALVAAIVRRMLIIRDEDDEATVRKALVAGMAPIPNETREVATAVFSEVLGYGARSELDPQAKRRLVVTVLRLLLRARSAERPLVLLLEDLHWMDDASRSVIAELIPEVAVLRCALLTTSRDAVSWPALTMALGLLDAQGAAALVDSLGGPQLDPQMRAVVLERTGGNPLFIEETIRAVRAGATTVPTTVQELLEARLDALPAPPRRVAQGAAVIGRTFRTRVLARVVADDDVPTELRALEGARFVHEVPIATEATYAFDHALVQEVVYRTQLVTQRARTHGEVGAALEDLYSDRTDEFVDDLAFHWDRSDNAPKAMFWLVKAGDRARGLYANAEALARYRAALPRAADGTGPLGAATILERIGDLELLVGRYDDAMATFAAARTRMGGDVPVTAARLKRKIAQVLRTLGRFDDTLPMYVAAMAELGESDDPEAVRIGIATSVVHLRRGDLAAARDILTKAVEAAQRLGVDDVIAEAYNYLAQAESLAGDVRASLAAFERARAIYERAENVRALANVRSNMVDSYLRLGRHQDALVEANASLAIRQRVGDPLWIGSSFNNRAEVYREMGDVDAALADYDRALERWTAFGHADRVPLALIGRGAAHAQAGDAEGARRDLDDAEQRLAAIKSTTYLPDLYRFRAETELRARDLDAAERAGREALARSQAVKARHQIAMAERVLGEIALARGDRAAARDLLERSRATLLELSEINELRKTEAAIARSG